MQTILAGLTALVALIRPYISQLSAFLVGVWADDMMKNENALHDQNIALKASIDAQKTIIALNNGDSERLLQQNWTAERRKRVRNLPTSSGK